MILIWIFFGQNIRFFYLIFQNIFSIFANFWINIISKTPNKCLRISFLDIADSTFSSQLAYLLNNSSSNNFQSDKSLNNCWNSLQTKVALLDRLNIIKSFSMFLFPSSCWFILNFRFLFFFIITTIIWKCSKNTNIKNIEL